MLSLVIGKQYFKLTNSPLHRARAGGDAGGGHTKNMTCIICHNLTSEPTTAYLGELSPHDPTLDISYHDSCAETQTKNELHRWWGKDLSKISGVFFAKIKLAMLELFWVRNLCAITRSLRVSVYKEVVNA